MCNNTPIVGYKKAVKEKSGGNVINPMRWQIKHDSIQ